MTIGNHKVFAWDYTTIEDVENDGPHNARHKKIGL